MARATRGRPPGASSCGASTRRCGGSATSSPALHEVDAPESFTSPAYRATPGPANTGEWQARMGHWHRNLFGLDHTPDVPMDARLVVVEDDGAAALPDRVPVTWMEAVGLD